MIVQLVSFDASHFNSAIVIVRKGEVRYVAVKVIFYDQSAGPSLGELIQADDKVGWSKRDVVEFLKQLSVFDPYNAILF